MSRKHAQTVNFKQWPYSGIFATIARRFTSKGDPISAEGVRQRYLRGNTETIRMVDREILKRARKTESGYAQ